MMQAVAFRLLRPALRPGGALLESRSSPMERRSLSFLGSIFGTNKHRRFEDMRRASEDVPEPIETESASEGSSKKSSNADGPVSTRRKGKDLKRQRYWPDPENALTMRFRNREVPLSKEHIRGGGYEPRGPKPPPKRLQEWEHKVEGLTLGPRKLNLVAKLIRKMPVENARLQLIYSKKAISKDVLLALDEACAKVRQESGLYAEDLIVGRCQVGGEIVGKRTDIKGRGRVGVIKKRVSHLHLVLYEHPSRVEGFFSRQLSHLTPDRIAENPSGRVRAYVTRALKGYARRETLREYRPRHLRERREKREKIKERVAT